MEVWVLLLQLYNQFMRIQWKVEEIKRESSIFLIFNKQNTKEYVKGTTEANLPTSMGCNFFLNGEENILFN